VRTLAGLSVRGFNDRALLVHEDVKQEEKKFQAKSAQAEQAILKYNNTQLAKLQESFLKKSGGSVEEVQLEDNDEIVERVPSHKITNDLLKEGKTIDDIAKERDLSGDTILGHIEKLLEQGEKVSLLHTLPSKDIVKKVLQAFKKLDTTKLSPVYEHLDGKVSYRDLRIVRASTGVK
jgi:ATP-dependent DNA helicase RecQ